MNSLSRRRLVKITGAAAGIAATPDLPFCHRDLFADVNDPQAHLRVAGGPEEGVGK